MKRLIFLVFITLSMTYGKQIKEFRLSNGIKCIFLNKKIPTFSLGILIKGGVSKIKSGEDGIEYLTLKTMIKGTKEIPYPFFFDTLESYGIEINVEPSLDYSIITFKSIRKFISQGIRIAGSIIKNPELAEKAFNKAKKEILSEILRKKEDPDEEVWETLEEEFYKGHPYKVKPEGKITTIKNLSLEDIKKYYEKHFKGNEIIIGFVGDLQENEFVKMAEKNFGEIKRGKYQEKEIPQFSENRGKLIKKYRDDLKTSYLGSKFPVPPPSHPDYPYLYLVMRVLSSRLWDRLRTENGLTYSTYAGISKKNANYGYMYFSSVFPDSAFKLLRAEIERIKKEKISEKEIKKTINSSKTSFFNRIAYTNKFVRTLLVDEYVTHNAEFSFKMFKKLEGATGEKLLNISREYLKDKNFIFAFLVKRTLK